MPHYDIRLLDCYGDEWDIFKRLKRHKLIICFEIATEYKPYKHYHIWVYSKSLSLQQMKRYIYNTPRKFKIRGKNNSHCEKVRYGLNAFRTYIRKEGNPVLQGDYTYDENIHNLHFI